MDTLKCQEPGFQNVELDTPESITPTATTLTRTSAIEDDLSSEVHDNLGFEQENMATKEVSRLKENDSVDASDIDCRVRFEPSAPTHSRLPALDAFQRNVNRRQTIQVPHKELQKRISSDSEDSVDGFGSIDSKDQLSRMSLLARSQSLRLPRETDVRKRRPGRLLRDLSFADSDGKKVHKFGELCGAVVLARRVMGAILEDEGEVSGQTDPASIFSTDVVAQMTSLMQELIDRGKVTQMALIDQASGHIVTSHPTWSLSDADVCGLVKTITDKHVMMLKMKIEEEIYTCFKHGQYKLVARAGGQVLVGQRTETCVVVARSRDDTPGSSLYELEEYADVLKERGW